MATGDYHATALAVGRVVGMVPPNSQVIIIQSEKETRPSSLPQAVSAEARTPLQRAEDAQENVSQISGQGLSAPRPYQQLTKHLCPACLLPRICAGEQVHNPAGSHHDPEQHAHDTPPCQRWHAVSSNQHHGLVFHVDNGNVHQDNALQALTALAQVRFVCQALSSRHVHAVLALYCAVCSE